MNQAARYWGIPLEQWLDLSTGINPVPWPVPAIPDPVWQRLPESDDGLEAVIREWANVSPEAGVLPIPGSQAAIQALPRLRPRGRIGIQQPAYSEHRYWWQAAGHEVVPFERLPSRQQLAALDGLVWLNPNNPTGERTPAGALMACHEQLAAEGGWLVVDEAFMDAGPGESLLPWTAWEGLLVMRSLGKFFGLAGLRAGMLFGPPELCRRLDALIGPWALSNPARFLMAGALADTRWQQATAQRLAADSERLAALLSHAGLTPAGRTELFVYCPHPDPERVADALARHGILVRVFTEPRALRFGLPGPDSDWRRLREVLESSPGVPI